MTRRIIALSGVPHGWDTGYLTRDGMDRIVLRDPDAAVGRFGGWEEKGFWVLIPVARERRDERRSPSLPFGMIGWNEVIALDGTMARIFSNGE